MYRNLIRRALQKASITFSSGATAESTPEEEAALRALIMVLRKEFREELFAPEKDGASNSVLFALNPETSPWAAVGVTGELDRIIWDLYGFTPQDAKPWIDIGVGADEAFEWRIHEVDYAIASMQRGWSPAKATDWRNMDPHEAQRWIDAGAGRKIADNWRSHGPENVPFVRQLQGWKNTYWSIDNEDDYAKQWRDMKLSDVVDFLPKGYTYRSAQSAIKKSYDAKTAPPVRGTALVAGKAFERLTSLARQGGWTVPSQPSDVIGLDLTPTVEAEYFHAEKGRRLTMVFSASGRFLACRDNWERRPLRSVGDTERVLAQPSRFIYQ